MVGTRLELTLDEISLYAEELHHNIILENEAPILTYTREEGKTYELVGHRIEADDQIYVIGVHEDLRFGVVAHLYGIPEALASMIDEGDVDRIVDHSDLTPHEDEPNKRAAARSLLSDVDTNLTEEVRNYLYIFAINGSNISVDISTDEQGAPALLTTESMLFPYEESFDLPGYYRKVQSVMSTSRSARYLFNSMMNVDIDEDQPENSQVIFSTN